MAVAFLGDGATDIGVFHEALNMASLWEVPASSSARTTATPTSWRARRTRRSNGWPTARPRTRCPDETVDGNDVEAVYDAAARAVARARAGGGPTLIECVTYRWRGHYEGDPQPYRTAAEVEEWKQRDPLGIAEERLRAAGALDDAAREAIWNETAARIDAAVEAAEAAPMPTPDEALEDVYAGDVEEGWA